MHHNVDSYNMLYFTPTVNSIKYGVPETASCGDISSIIKCSSQKRFIVRVKLRLFGGQQWKTWESHKLGPGFVPTAEAAWPRSQLWQMKQVQACALRCTMQVHYGLCSVKQYNDDVSGPRCHTYIHLTRHNHQIYVLYATQSAAVPKYKDLSRKIQYDAAVV